MGMLQMLIGLKIYKRARIIEKEKGKKKKKKKKKKKAEVMKLLALLLTPVVLLFMTQSVEAVEYQVFNKAIGTIGSARFEKEIGVTHTINTLAKASNFTWHILGQAKMSDRKNFTHVRLYIDDWDGIAVTRNNDILVSASFIGNFTGDVKAEFTKLLYHWAAHVWQWTGNEQAPNELIEGIADFVMFQAQNPALSQGTVMGGHGRMGKRGSPWESNGHFVGYLNEIKEGFLSALDGKLRQGYNTKIFEDMFGSVVEELWDQYQDKECN